MTKNSNPLVSVVIPVYNGGHILSRALQSVVQQTYEHFECVVLDNCSTDNTPAIIEQFARCDSRIRSYRNTQVLPIMINHNAVIGMRAPNSKYCQILHADDELAPSCLEKKVAIGERHSSVGIIGSYVNWSGKRRPAAFPAESECFLGRDIARGTLLGQYYPFLTPSCVLFRTQVIARRAMMYNEMKLHADIEAVYEILSTDDFGFAHDTLVYVGRMADSATAKQVHPMRGLLASNLELLVNYGPRFLSPAEYRGRLRKYINRYYRGLARALVDRPGRDFWSYHEQVFEQSGLRFRYHRVMIAGVWEVGRTARASVSRLMRGPR